MQDQGTNPLSNELDDDFSDPERALTVKSENNKLAVCRQVSPSVALKYGKPCPFCGKGPVEYDSSLNVVCLNCGKLQAGAFT